MSADSKEVALDVLLINGILTLGAGLALLYLPGIMSIILFDVLAVAVTVLLTGTVFLMIGMVDFAAAFSIGFKRPLMLLFYSLLGVAFVTSGVYVLYGPSEVIEFLVVFTIIHGVIFGFLGFLAATQQSLSKLETAALYFFAVASVAMSGWIAGIFEKLDDRSSLGWIGAYLCLVGLKLLFLARASHRRITLPVGTKIGRRGEALTGMGRRQA